MKCFCKNLLFSRISPALWLIAAALGFFFVSGISEQKAENVRLIYSFSHQQKPLSPAPAENQKRGTFQTAIPGSLPPVVVSRRNNEPVALRLLHGNNTGICRQNISLSPVFFCTEKYKQSYHFSFQSFLRHSLPPRAGPETI